MKCPHCQKEISSATDKQIEAYRLCYIVGCTQAEAADVLNVTQVAVHKLLKRLKVSRPELFEHHNIRKHKTSTYNELMQMKVIKQW